MEILPAAQADNETESPEQESGLEKAPALPRPPDRRRGAEALPADAYNNPRLGLFQGFVCNGEAERERLSNTLDLWDCVPRYSVSKMEMNKRRDAKGNLPPLSLEFHYRGQAYRAEIYPATVKEGDRFVAYYPSASEELVEDALRKIALRENGGFFDRPTMRGGVAFTLYGLRAELAARGHARRYVELVQSLTILQMSHIKICNGEGRGESLVAANYLPAVAAVSRQTLEEDPDARWIAQFHPLMARSLDQLTYRQFNYVTMMGLPTQLARWLYRQLSIKFTFASIVGNPFEMRYSTIRRDSNLLNRGRERDNQSDVSRAFAELVGCRMLREAQKQAVIGARGKVEDVIYQLHPTPEFIREVKAANKRQKDYEQNR